ncbi:MAG: uracil-DNA glycosylase [Emcibacter sp.]|nr:uracil-DNA glycosylase [Emcibacter sp.]
MTTDAPLNCALCPRLVEFRVENKNKYPHYFNAPVPSFGDNNHEILIVGLAPGLKGANQTGRPFTGDYAGDLLYATLTKFGYTEGAYGANAHDGLILKNVLITNAVRCVPPQNKTTTEEENNCRPFLIRQIKSASRLKLILVLGLVAHNAVLTTFQKKKSAFKFSHGAVHNLGNEMGKNITLIDSYHCSRYNTNTGRLTQDMFEDVFQKINSFFKQQII